MRSRLATLLVLLPAFGLWWAGYLVEDTGRRKLSGALVRWPLGAAVAAALGLAIAGAVRAGRQGAAGRLGAAVAVGLAWLLTVVAACLLVLLAHREDGPEPHLMLPITWAAGASLLLAVEALGAASGRDAGRPLRHVAAPLLAGLAVPAALLALRTLGVLL